jgi:neutral ceramidase
LPLLYAAWEAAGADMQTEIALEMMSRSIEKGPYPETFSIRGGQLEYLPFERDRVADAIVYTPDGAIASPIDEFNAPVGAGLCEADVTDPGSAYPLFPAGLMPGTDMLPPYGACVRVDAAADILGTLLDLDLEADATHPMCQSTRTTISALRIGDTLIGTIPGELTVELARRIRDSSPVAPEKTVLLGYAQGHIGYCLTAEDWLSGGYEPSINIYGPLEGEYVAEQLLDLMPLALTSDREDAAAGGADRLSVPEVDDGLVIDDPAPGAGSVPESVPERVWSRLGALSSTQPDAQIPRVRGHATFVWIGDDPNVKTPVVTLEREVAPDVFEPVRRRSGRVVRDSELLLMYTPSPLEREGNEPLTHYWVAEWQAVPWLGAVDALGQGLDAMGARAGVPTGRYRFHVVGAAFDIASAPFEVVPATIGVAVSRTANMITLDVAISDPDSYRLLDMARPSNAAVPLREGMFAVRFHAEGAEPIERMLAVDGNGRITADLGADAAGITSVSVEDRFGNTGAATLP